ncbi:MAG: hypothetical protein ACR2OX_11830, partial [Methyloligellaceae bacterium]
MREGWLLVLALCTALIILPVTDAAAARRKPPWQAWKSSSLADHALTGRILDTDQGIFLTPGEL